MSTSTIKNQFTGILLVFLTYFYFLLFTQFTFLELMEGQVRDPASLKVVLSAMAIAGIGGSLLAVARRSFIMTGHTFAPLLGGCALIAFISPYISNVWGFALAAALMGMMVGVLTVSIAAMLPGLFPSRRRGLYTGLSTGLAYAVCNLPFVFAASPMARSLLSGALMLSGAILLLYRKSHREFWRFQTTQEPAQSWPAAVLICMMLVLGALVWFDSAVFYLIQQTRELKTLSWEGPAQLTMNAGLHLAAACLSGFLLDRGHGLFVLGMAWLGLAVGALGLQLLDQPVFTAFYVAGVSLYSVALVFIPSQKSAAPGDRGSFFRAGLIFSVSGWIASGMGIGMAENLARVPVLFLVITFIVMGFSLRVRGIFA